MRELKFRAWANGYEKWCHRIEYIDDGFWLGYVDDGVGELSTTDIIVEQYTGLKDKNGKEIYEGDIVEEEIDFNSKMTDGTFRYEVYWNEDELCWSLDHIGQKSIHGDLWELNSSRRVIGNIHERREEE
jgi:uncharacterized phage protein (TIGR01671 family)